MALTNSSKVAVAGAFLASAVGIGAYWADDKDFNVTPEKMRSGNVALCVGEISGPFGTSVQWLDKSCVEKRNQVNDIETIIKLIEIPNKFDDRRDLSAFVAFQSIDRVPKVSLETYNRVVEMENRLPQEERERLYRTSTCPAVSSLGLSSKCMSLDIK